MGKAKRPPRNVGTGVQYPETELMARGTTLLHRCDDKPRAMRSLECVFTLPPRLTVGEFGAAYYLVPWRSRLDGISRNIALDSRESGNDDYDYSRTKISVRGSGGIFGGYSCASALTARLAGEPAAPLSDSLCRMRASYSSPS